VYYREYGSNGSKVTLERESLHIMDDSRRIALVDTKTEDVSVLASTLPDILVRYQFSNYLNSSSLELDQQAKIISFEEYFPYGATSYQAVRSKTETAKRYRYTGKEQDEETGFAYHGARYYVSWLGRWASGDPIGIRDGVNIFVYVSNNPILKMDSSGLQGNPPDDDDKNKRFAVASTTATLKPRVRELGPEVIYVKVGENTIPFFNPGRLSKAEFFLSLPKPREDKLTEVLPTAEGALAARNTQIALENYKGESTLMKISIVLYNFVFPAVNTLGGPLAKYKEMKQTQRANQSTTKAPIQTVGKYVEKKSETAWGGSIGKQGKAYETQMLKQDPDLIGLPTNFKTFDSYGWTSEAAVSAKTYNINTSSRTIKPEQMFSTLKKYVDAAASFETYKLSGVEVSKEIIQSRVLSIALPNSINYSNVGVIQEQMKKTIEYGKQQGIDVRFPVMK
jgi:RHS repeat-associated protein